MFVITVRHDVSVTQAGQRLCPLTLANYELYASYGYKSALTGYEDLGREFDIRWPRKLLEGITKVGILRGCSRRLLSVSAGPTLVTLWESRLKACQIKLRSVVSALHP